ncbi:MAG: hypothetical protein GX664_06435 [Bacteroidales bacterium]|nr:hypothetical protein [Bacteroidales bacterium]
MKKYLLISAIIVIAAFSFSQQREGHAAGTMAQQAGIQLLQSKIDDTAILPNSPSSPSATVQKVPSGRSSQSNSLLSSTEGRLATFRSHRCSGYGLFISLASLFHAMSVNKRPQAFSCDFRI